MKLNRASRQVLHEALDLLPFKPTMARAMMKLAEECLPEGRESITMDTIDDMMTSELEIEVSDKLKDVLKTKISELEFPGWAMKAYVPLFDELGIEQD